jgi:hypothetical protein
LDKYYYLISSLPLLFFDTEKFPQREEFLEQCRMSMNPVEFDILESCSIELTNADDGLPQVLKDWYSWEASMRNELALLRSKKLNFSEEYFVKSSVSDNLIRESAKKAFDEKSPLNAEIILDKARWDYLSDNELGHYFDLTFIIIYYLKIQLLQRQADFITEKGITEFSRIKDKIFQRINHSQEKTLEKE